MWENDPKPRKVRESSIEKKFTDWCKEQGVTQYKLQLFGLRGYPDRTVYLGRGRVALIEFKAPGGKTTSGQDKHLQTARDHGIPVLVTCDWKEAADWVTQIMKALNESAD